MRGTDAAVVLIASGGRDAIVMSDALHRVAGGVRVVADEQEAMDYVFGTGAYAYRSGRRPPRLIVIALKEGGANGLGPLRLLKSDPRTRSIPVVVLARSSGERNRRRYFEAGANSVVELPESRRELARKLAAVGHYWTARNEAPRE